MKRKIPWKKEQETPQRRFSYFHNDHQCKPNIQLFVRTIPIPTLEWKGKISQLIVVGDYVAPD